LPKDAGLKIPLSASKVAAMKDVLICAGLLFAGVLPRESANGQTVTVKAEPPTVSFTTVEPGRIDLAQLFKMSDFVAVVSGDTENYKTTMYKAVVVTSFKRTASGQTIYFGPYDGGKMGSEYVVFLRIAKEPAVPTTTPTAAYGTVKYMEVFNEGYSEMETSYACVFHEKDADAGCDYGVRVCTDFIVLPKEVRAIPPEKNDPPFGCRWVRKSNFLGLLDQFADKPGIF
jgi:hypothetical protein